MPYLRCDKIVHQIKLISRWHQNISSLKFSTIIAAYMPCYKPCPFPFAWGHATKESRYSSYLIKPFYIRQASIHNVDSYARVELVVHFVSHCVLLLAFFAWLTIFLSFNLCYMFSHLAVRMRNNCFERKSRKGSFPTFYKLCILYLDSLNVSMSWKMTQSRYLRKAIFQWRRTSKKVMFVPNDFLLNT